MRCMDASSCTDCISNNMYKDFTIQECGCEYIFCLLYHIISNMNGWSIHVHINFKINIMSYFLVCTKGCANCMNGTTCQQCFDGYEQVLDTDGTILECLSRRRIRDIKTIPNSVTHIDILYLFFNIYRLYDRL